MTSSNHSLERDLRKNWLCFGAVILARILLLTFLPPRLIEDPGQGIGAGLIFRRVRVMEAGWDEEVVVDHGSI